MSLRHEPCGPQFLPFLEERQAALVVLAARLAETASSRPSS
jgi:hypothetical protein